MKYCTALVNLALVAGMIWSSGGLPALSIGDSIGALSEVDSKESKNSFETDSDKTSSEPILSHSGCDPFYFMQGKWKSQDADHSVEELWTKDPERNELFCIRSIRQREAGTTYEIYKLCNSGRGARVDVVRLNQYLKPTGDNWIGLIEVYANEMARFTLQDYPQKSKSGGKTEAQSYKKLSSDSVRVRKIAADGSCGESFILSRVKQNSSY
ncbi:MAG: hypothetical protein JSS86_09100 [Cyanobacteria bacterium SZAS LIN-2]|nr:hypothetical protein [Cyanobacteria bacterium SZAS LIN-3]MBS1996454.1 hypothetical protein [Cyanobacteria bacterium SZAS LIN-2]